jgi:beta-lactamase class A
MVAVLAAPALVSCGRGAVSTPTPPAGPAGPPNDGTRVAAAGPALDELESRFGGRVGVYALDTGSGATITHRAAELFPMCSTFKILAAGAILRLRQSQPGLLDRLVRYDRSKVVSASPVTSLHVADGMTVSGLCHAAVTQSDNTAANLLLEILGGPGAVTQFARSLGDPVTRLDRWEPQLNDVPPGEQRDTTAPERMAGNLRALVLGNALDPAGRDLLTDWLVANQTGGTRIRAGLPAGWRVGDKTGSGDRGEVNDVAVVWPPTRAPLIIAVYTVPGDPKAGPNNAVPSAASIVARVFVPPS